MEHIIKSGGGGEGQEDQEQKQEVEQKLPPTNLVPCRNNCGFVYCTSKCEADAYTANGHSLLCTGSIVESEAEAHSLIRWKIHAMQSNEIFIVVGQIIAKIVVS
jgi:hypothetical protein